MVAAAAAAAVVVGFRRHVVVKIALGRHVCSIGLLGRRKREMNE